MNLEQLLSSALLPTLPQVAVRLLEVMKDPEAEMGDVIDTIKIDPATCTKILKAANSSYFTFRAEVTSIDRAVPLLGTNVVSSLVLSFSLVDSITTSGPLAKHYQIYWKRSIAHAAAAEIIGGMSGSGQACENFLAGLLMDVGRLAMLRTMGDAYLPVLEQAETVTDQFEIDLEKNAFGYDHTDVGAGLLKQWGLDSCLADTADMHHDSLEKFEVAEQLPHFPLIKTAAMASAVCDYLCDQQIGLALERINDYAPLFGLDKNGVKKMLDDVREKIESVAEMFSVDVSSIGNPQDLLIRATEQMAQISMRQQMELSQAAMQHQETESKKQELENQNSQLREQAFIDPLTDVYNRRSFDDALKKEIARCQREDSQVGIILIDIDRFKNLNDTYGHQFGDEVLQAVAQTLNNTVREADTFARYGGEEFVAIAHQPTLEGLDILSERLRKAVEDLSFDFEQKTVKVTISLGATMADANLAPSDKLIVNLIARADQLLYRSKESGRNRYYVEELNLEPLATTQIV